MNHPDSTIPRPGVGRDPGAPSSDAASSPADGPDPSPAEAACLWALAERECLAPHLQSMLASAAQLLRERWPHGAPQACVIRFDGAEYGAGDVCGAGGRVSAELAVGGVVRGTIALQISSAAADFLAPAAGFLLKVADFLSRALVRRLADDWLRREVQLSQAVEQVSRELVGPPRTLAELAKTVLEKVLGLTAGERGFVCHLDPADGDCVVLAYTAGPGERGPDPIGETFRFPAGPDGRYGALWGAALNSKQAFFTNDAAHHPLFRGVPAGHARIDCFLAAPALVGERVIGQIGVANARTGFDDGHLEAVRRLADLLALALHRREAEQSREASELRFLRLAESAKDLIWRTDARGTVLYVNPAVRSLLGYLQSEAIGLTIEKYTRPQSIERVRTWLEGSLQSTSAGALKGEVEYIHKDGSSVPVEIHATVQRDTHGAVVAVEGISRHIADRLAAEAAVRRSEEQLRAIITHMPVMLHAFDEEGRIVVWNRECEEVTGYAASEMVGNPRALDLLYPDPAQRARIVRGLQPDHADYRGWELLLSRKDGSTRTIEWSSIAKRFRVAGWATWGIGVDVSHQRGALEERRAMDGQLSDQQRNRAIGTLAAGVAHEINNPTNIIMNYARLIADEAPEGSLTKDDALQIVAESERIAHIVSELHSLSAVGTSAPSLASVAQILENVIGLVRGTLAQDGIAVTTSIPDGLPLLECRPAEVGQVLQNLLENARDALNTRYPGNDPDKQLIIAAERFSRDGRPWARLTVQDHGVGIPDDIRPRIFDPFFSTKPRAVGTGLGLYIAQRLVAQHGGQITVDSQLDRGTRIHVELPAREEPAELAAGMAVGDREGDES